MLFARALGFEEGYVCVEMFANRLALMLCCGGFRRGHDVGLYQFGFSFEVGQYAPGRSLFPAACCHFSDDPATVAVLGNVFSRFDGDSVLTVFAPSQWGSSFPAFLILPTC